MDRHSFWEQQTGEPITDAVLYLLCGGKVHDKLDTAVCDAIHSAMKGGPKKLEEIVAKVKLPPGWVERVTQSHDDNLGFYEPARPKKPGQCKTREQGAQAIRDQLAHSLEDLREALEYAEFFLANPGNGCPDLAKHREQVRESIRRYEQQIEFLETVEVFVLPDGAIEVFPPLEEMPILGDKDA